MPRVYVRKFDWDEARRLRDEGLSYERIGVQLGVTAMAVNRALNPHYRERERERMEGYKTADRCDRCGKPKSLLSFYTNGSRHCRACAMEFMRVAIGDGVLRCVTCKEWKPDEDYPRNRDEHAARRGRHSQCRACSTIARQEYRERNKVPCTFCGKPCLPPNEKRHNGTAYPRCRECFYAGKRL